MTKQDWKNAGISAVFGSAVGVVAMSAVALGVIVMAYGGYLNSFGVAFLGIAPPLLGLGLGFSLTETSNYPKIIQTKLKANVLGATAFFSMAAVGILSFSQIDNIKSFVDDSLNISEVSGEHTKDMKSNSSPKLK